MGPDSVNTSVYRACERGNRVDRSIDMSHDQQRGGDCLTTFISGAIGLIVFFVFLVLILSFLFG